MNFSADNSVQKLDTRNTVRHQRDICFQSVHSPPIPINFAQYNNNNQYQNIMLPSPYGTMSIKKETGDVDVSNNFNIENDDVPIDLSSNRHQNVDNSGEDDPLNSAKYEIKNDIDNNNINVDEEEEEEEEEEEKTVYKSFKIELMSPEIQIEYLAKPEEKINKGSNYQRKRKSNSLNDNDDDDRNKNNYDWVLCERKILTNNNNSDNNNQELNHEASKSQEEVLKAARSLFSKRTRTLYHWLYPNTSKTQLKTTVANAWDGLSVAEKEFYISQVLGRFGVPAGNLMVNPQLDGFNAAVMQQHQSEETRSAVSNLILSENADMTMMSTKRKRRRNGAGDNDSQQQQHQCAEMDEQTLLLQQMGDDVINNDFADDPELHEEFEQFRWALHVSNAEQK